MPRLDKSNVRDCFQYHAPDGARAAHHAAINKATADLAELYFDHCPESPELTLAIRKLQEARMWANSALATNNAPQNTYVG